MTDWLYDEVAGMTWDLAPWQQLLVLGVFLGVVVLTGWMLLACRDLRRQRQLDRRIRERYTLR